VTAFNIPDSPNTEMILTIGELKKTEPSFRVGGGRYARLQEFYYGVRYGKECLRITNDAIQISCSVGDSPVG